MQTAFNMKTDSGELNEDDDRMYISKYRIWREWLWLHNECWLWR